MARKITEQEKALARLVIENSTGVRKLPAYECYRMVYGDGNAARNTAAKKASEILKRPCVRQYIGKLQGGIMRRHNITVDSLVEELEEARQLAMKGDPETGKAIHAGHAVSAIMGKAKLCGLDKQVIDHISSDGTMSPQVIELVAKVNDETKSDS